jgi:hypothetical protein
MIKVSINVTEGPFTDWYEHEDDKRYKEFFVVGVLFLSVFPSFGFLF